jgi:hypothetical protein
MQAYFIASVAHTQKADRYITFWRAENKGYAWPLSWSGKYSEEAVLQNMEYYNDGWHTIAVPADVVEKLAVGPGKGTVDNDAGPVVLNTPDNWDMLLQAVIRQPLHEVKLYPM